ncbi:SGNH/GDSL hydrolase family protein [Promicromonospora sp. NPDC060204]|uniref:SGNH/GDSL hydrolase family protein n=1 Tax=Promicromonospora sp. NPDC060204 TaxID=3347071 RepID=UPI003646456B
MKRWLVSGGIAVSVVAAFAVAVLVGMVLGAGGIAVGGTGGASVPAPRGAPSVWAESPSPSPSPSPVAEKEPVALFVGDSYTVGQGATSPELRWSTLVSEKMGWRELNVADGGTGFVKGNPELDKLNYPAQLRSVPKGSVDIVVIAGGQNDFKDLRAEPAPVFEAVADTYALAVQRFPDAEIVSVGPSTPWAVGLEARALDSAVRAAAAEAEATYVSLLDPNIVQGRLVHEDGIHTTDAGNAAIARRVVRTLQAPAADVEETGARPADILTSR